MEHKKHEYKAGDKFTFYGLPTFQVAEPIQLKTMPATRQWCQGCFFWDVTKEQCRDEEGMFPCNGHQRKDMKFVYFVEEGNGEADK
ncbi:MAG: hypothetical protein Q4C95_13145 [Planctomycetia bacterium]|nr:hypothetical protein [Planctomycetia bacterium]